MSTTELIVIRSMERDIIKDIRDSKYAQAAKQLETLVAYAGGRS